MGSLVIRDLDDDVKARLRIQAAEHGRSMEAEARAILAAAVLTRRPSTGLGSFIHDSFRDIADLDLPIPERDDPARHADLR